MVGNQDKAWRMTPNFIHQGHAEDVLLWHRFNYYVLGCPLITDQEYDTMERAVRARWSVGVLFWIRLGVMM